MSPLAKKYISTLGEKVKDMCGKLFIYHRGIINASFIGCMKKNILLVSLFCTILLSAQEFRTINTFDDFNKINGGYKPIDNSCVCGYVYIVDNEVSFNQFSRVVEPTIHKILEYQTKSVAAELSYGQVSFCERLNKWKFTTGFGESRYVLQKWDERWQRYDNQAPIFECESSSFEVEQKGDDFNISLNGVFLGHYKRVPIPGDDEWLSIRGLNKPSDYSIFYSFAEKYPKNRFASEARERGNNLKAIVDKENAFNRAMYHASYVNCNQYNSDFEINEFIRNYPNDPLIEKIKTQAQRTEDAEWDKVNRENTSEGYICFYKVFEHINITSTCKERRRIAYEKYQKALAEEKNRELEQKEKTQYLECVRLADYMRDTPREKWNSRDIPAGFVHLDDYHYRFGREYVENFLYNYANKTNDIYVIATYLRIYGNRYLYLDDGVVYPDSYVAHLREMKVRAQTPFYQECLKSNDIQFLDVYLRTYDTNGDWNRQYVRDVKSRRKQLR